MLLLYKASRPNEADNYIIGVMSNGNFGLDGEDAEPPQRMASAPPTSRVQQSAREFAEWDAEDALAQLAVTRTAAEDITEKDTAERVFRENLPVAAMSICHMAKYSTTESIRFKAAQYVVERNLGRLQDAPPLTPNSNDPFKKLMEDCGMIPGGNDNG